MIECQICIFACESCLDGYKLFTDKNKCVKGLKCPLEYTEKTSGICSLLEKDEVSFSIKPLSLNTFN